MLAEFIGAAQELPAGIIKSMSDGRTLIRSPALEKSTFVHPELRNVIVLTVFSIVLTGINVKFRSLNKSEPSAILVKQQ